MPKLVNLIEKQFGKLAVIKRANNDKYGNSGWLCRCECGQLVVVVSLNLKSGDTKSCGCLRKEVTRNTGCQNVEHGHCANNHESMTYGSWHSMIQRCTNPNNKDYRNYGGREITVCDRWRNSFQNFLEDMGEHPGSGYSLDRKDNEKGYCKENCRWATPTEQSRNKQNNLYMTYDGKRQLLVEWSEETGIPYKTLWERSYKLGWSTERALTTPIEGRKN